jgi:hypothetical protein
MEAIHIINKLLNCPEPSIRYKILVNVLESDKFIPNGDYVDWGGQARMHMNEWVTADALYVMKAAGRII